VEVGLGVCGSCEGVLAASSVEDGGAALSTVGITIAPTHLAARLATTAASTAITVALLALGARKVHPALGLLGLGMAMLLGQDPLFLDNLGLHGLALDNLALDNLALDNLALDNLALDNLALDNLLGGTGDAAAGGALHDLLGGTGDAAAAGSAAADDAAAAGSAAADDAAAAGSAAADDTARPVRTHGAPDTHGKASAQNTVPFHPSLKLGLEAVAAATATSARVAATAVAHRQTPMASLDLLQAAVSLLLADVATTLDLRTRRLVPPASGIRATGKDGSDVAVLLKRTCLIVQV